MSNISIDWLWGLHRHFIFRPRCTIKVMVHTRSGQVLVVIRVRCKERVTMTEVKFGIDIKWIGCKWCLWRQHNNYDDTLTIKSKSSRSLTGKNWPTRQAGASIPMAKTPPQVCERRVPGTRLPRCSDMHDIAFFKSKDSISPPHVICGMSACSLLIEVIFTSNCISKWTKPATQCQAESWRTRQ